MLGKASDKVAALEKAGAIVTDKSNFIVADFESIGISEIKHNKKGDILEDYVFHKVVSAAICSGTMTKTWFINDFIDSD